MVENRKDESNKLTNLLVLRKEAEEKINTQIQKGLAIKDISITSLDSLDIARAQYYEWNSYNSELLKRIFDTQELSKEYIGFILPRGINQTFPEKIAEYKNDVQRKIDKLKSIAGRLELYKEPSLANVKKKRETKNISKINTFLYNPYTVKIIAGIILFFITYYLTNYLFIRKKKNNKIVISENTVTVGQFANKSAVRSDNIIVGDNNKVIFNKDTQNISSGREKDKRDKLQVIKIQINRIVDDSNSWLETQKEQNNKEQERIVNDFSRRNVLEGSGHIQSQIDRVNKFIKSTNEYLKEVTRKIEDLLLEVKEYNFEKVPWLTEEYKRFIEFTQFCDRFKIVLKQQNTELCSRFLDSENLNKILKENPYKE